MSSPEILPLSNGGVMDLSASSPIRLLGTHALNRWNNQPSLRQCLAALAHLMLAAASTSQPITKFEALQRTLPDCHPARYAVRSSLDQPKPGTHLLGAQEPHAHRCSSLTSSGPMSIVATIACSHPRNDGSSVTLTST